MLSPEEAKSRLDQRRVTNFEARMRARVLRLPDRARSLAAVFVDPKSGERIWRRVDPSYERLGERIDALEPADRDALFRALFPEIADDALRAWGILSRQAYGVGSLRRGFRAPNHPALSHEARANWLEDLLRVMWGYEEDVAWLAAWSEHLTGWNTSVGDLLAVVVDGGGERAEAILGTLIAAAEGRHDVAVPGRQSIRALALCSRPEAWVCVERLLVRAQREEGLRQVILESVDLAHPECFRRILAQIAEQDLARFSAVARAVDVWLGMQWDSEAARHIGSIAERLATWIPDRDARLAALRKDRAEDVYLALYLEARDDVVAVVDLARPLLRHASAEVRYAALKLLSETRHTRANWAIADALGDPDIRVSALAVESFSTFADCTPEQPDLFERLEAELQRWPEKPRTEDAILWPWCRHTLDRTRIGRALLETLGDRPLSRLRSHSTILDSSARLTLCDRLLSGPTPSTGDARAILIEFLGDPATMVRDRALEAVAATRLGAGEEAEVEALLTRKNEGLRIRLLDLLLTLDDVRLLASADRLLAARDERQRAGGLEVLRRLRGAGRLSAWCEERAKAYASGREALTSGEQSHLHAISVPAETVSLDDALGLSPRRDRTPIPDPQDLRAGFPTRAAKVLLEALDALVEHHAATSVSLPSLGGSTSTEVAFGALHSWNIWSDRDDHSADPPLWGVFESFWKGRAERLRDEDGLEGMRALWRARADTHYMPSGIVARFRQFLGVADAKPLRFPGICDAYLRWFLHRDPPPLAVDFALDAYETALARLAADPRGADDVSSGETPAARWCAVVGGQAFDLWRAETGRWSQEQIERLWNLERFAFLREEGQSGRETMDLWIAVTEAGIARPADLLGWLARPERPREPGVWSSRDDNAWALRCLSGQRTLIGTPIPPRTGEIVQRLRDRLLEVEFARGEAQTVATRLCGALRWTGGLDVVARASRALGKESLRRHGHSYWSSAPAGRGGSFSALLRSTRPAEGETPEGFAQRLPLAEVGEERLLEIALFAPQWSPHAERAIGWPGLADAVWWIHAHTKDSRWSVDPELRDAWSAQTSERTPLSAQDLLEGAVDVDWFMRVRGAFGEARFERLLRLAKFASSSGAGHARARLFATALLGGVTTRALIARIRDKRNADSVRALGLVPLPAGEAAQAEVLSRYLEIQEFLRGTRKFGSQRQQSEKRAAAIGLDNLARTAGYVDPIRLEWAMERAALGDLARGSVGATVGDLEVRLAIDEQGDPQLSVSKQGKSLKKVPAAAKKEPEIKALTDRVAALTQQKRRMAQALEAAMIRGDAIGGAELGRLLEHPVLAPLLRRLVLVGSGLHGYPATEAGDLVSHDGRHAAVPPDAQLRVAHPLDLLASEWPLWQRDCLRREVIQPFKQVYRELYVLTEAERQERLRSRRYAGHQVQPRQAMALLGARGWVWHSEEGVRRVDHASGLAAWIEFLNAPFTPAEVEGLTIESVAFARKGEWEVLPLESVPPRLFSEVMRDLDLVVSVASRAGVDPEASASSVEARAALVRETCGLLGLENVRIDGRHAYIDGTLGRYSLHLGSAVVHRLPGGHLCIVPVHAQHRGRVFLPFADDDPKTAEILAKVLMLARDHEIKDPTILEQIRR